MATVIHMTQQGKGGSLGVEKAKAAEKWTQLAIYENKSEGEDSQKANLIILYSLYIGWCNTKTWVKFIVRPSKVHRVCYLILKASINIFLILKKVFTIMGLNQFYINHKLK